MLVLIYIANHPPVYSLGYNAEAGAFRRLLDHPDDQILPGLLMLRSEGMLYFASAPRAIEHYWVLIDREMPKVVILECSAIPNIEYTALGLLDDFEKRLSEEGIELWLAFLNPEALQVIENSTLGKRLTHTRMFFSLRHADNAYQAITEDLEGLK